MKNRQRELEERWQLLNRKDKKKWTKELRPNTIIKKGLPNLIIPEKRKKKLDVIIVSVNYNDLLAVSLPINKKVFDNITVVTSKEDSLCQRICQKFRVNCVVTDSMYDDDSEFNKGKAINEGIKSVQNPDYILLLDADTIVQENIDLETLDDDVLYTSPRYICKSYKLLKSLLFENKRPQDIFTIEGDKGIGFFQLFNINNNSINRDKVYPEFSSDASWDDLIFRDKFPKRKSIDNRVIHLGDPYINWKGRKTNRFLSDEELYEILTKKSTYTICSYYFNYNDDIRQKNNFIRFLEQFNDEHLEKMIVGIPESEQIDFDIPCKLVKVNTSNKIWSKEIIINKICEKIDTDYLIWIDGDIIYDNLDWLDNIDKVVEDCDFTQLFSKIIYLSENDEVIETHKSLMSANSQEVDRLLGKGYKPGGCWLGRVDILKKNPLYEGMIVGGGDTIFTYGLFGFENGWTLEKVKESNEVIYQEAKNWISNFGTKKVNYLDTTIYHLYHGELKDRNYNERYKKLKVENSNSENESVTIIIPCFKAYEFIDDCIGSIVNQNFPSKFEILIGVDKCIETYEHIKKSETIKKYCKVFYFDINVGPYIIRNTLAEKSKYQNIFFFDADDIMEQNLIVDTLQRLKENDAVRWRFYNFTDSIENKKLSTMRANGAFAIRKDTFMELKGFLPWRISADAEFRHRMDFHNKKTDNSDILFLRRIHSENLTQRKDTGMKSPERKRIDAIVTEKLNNNLFENPEILNTSSNIGIDFNLNINSYFEKIWCLNLKRRKDRRKLMSEKLNKLGIEFEFFDAIDGNKLDIKKYNLENYKSSNTEDNYKYELACSLSHIEIIKKSKSLKLNNILILEDDVLISDEIEIHLQKLKNITDWKLLYLGCSQYNWNIEMFNKDFFYSKDSLGTFAYAINSEIYEEVINTLSNFSTTADNSISEIQKKYYGFCFSFYPNICIADVTDSDIREKRDFTTHSERMRWNLIKNYV